MSDNYEETINELEAKLSTARKLWLEMDQKIRELTAENKRLANKANTNIMDQIFTFSEKVNKNMPEGENTEFKTVPIASDEWMRGESDE